MKQSNAHRVRARLLSATLLFLLLATEALSAQIRSMQQPLSTDPGRSIAEHGPAPDSSRNGIVPILPPAPHAADPDGAVLPEKNKPGIELTAAGFYGYGLGEATWEPLPGSESFIHQSNHYHEWGIEAGYTAPTSLFPWLAYSLRASFSARTTRLVGQPPNIAFFFQDSGNPRIVDQALEYWETMEMLQLELAPSLRIEPIDAVAIDVGGAIGIHRTIEWRQGESLLEPTDTHFMPTTAYPMSDDQRTLFLASGNSLPNERSLTLALLAGVSYTFRFSEALSVAPELRFRYDCVDPASDIGFKPFAVQGALRFGLRLGSGPKEAEKISDLAAPPSPTAPPRDVAPDTTEPPAHGSIGPEITGLGFYGYGSGSSTWKLSPIQYASKSSHYHDWGIEAGYTAPIFSRLAYSLRGSFSARSSRFTAQWPGVSVLVPNPPADPTPATQIVEDWATLHTIQAELIPAISFAPFDGLAVEFGGAIGIRHTIEWKNGRSIIAPQTATFLDPQPAGYILTDSGRTVIIASGTTPSTEKPLTLALLADVSYMVRLPFGLSAGPEVRLRYDCASPDASIDFRPLGIQAALRFGLSLGSGPKEAGKISDLAAPPPHVEPAPHPPGRLTAGIDLYSLDESGAAIQHVELRRRDLLRTNTILLPDLILFDGNETAMPARYLNAMTGNPDSAARLDPAAACDRILAVLGARLRATPSARLTLDGSTGNGITASVARARAEAVRQALIGRWGCRPGQISIAAVRSDAAVPGAVLIRPADPALMMVEASWRERGVRATPIKVTPMIQADNGLRRWDLEFRQGSTTIARKSSDDADQRMNLDMLVGRLSDTEAPSPLEAHLTVTDSAGNVVTGDDELAFELGAGVDSARIGSYIAVPGLAAAANDLGEIEPLLSRIAARLRPGARIAIHPLLAADEVDHAAQRLQAIADRITTMAGGRATISIAEAPKPSPARADEILRNAVEIDVTEGR